MDELDFISVLDEKYRSTYNEIEGSSQYFWCYQRYEMIQEFVDRPSVAPPFLLIWYSFELTGFIFGKLKSLIFNQLHDKHGGDDPFCRSLEQNSELERKLTKWEHMMGSRCARADTAEGAGAGKWAGGSRGEGHAFVLRVGGAGASGGRGKSDLGRGPKGGGVSGADPSSILQGIGPIFGPETEFIEHRFHEFNSQLGRLTAMEEKLAKITQTANGLIKIMRHVTQQQKQVMFSLQPTNGRRLVGRGHKGEPGYGTSSRNLIVEAVSNAVAGLGSHCSVIEEKIEEN